MLLVSNIRFDGLSPFQKLEHVARFILRYVLHQDSLLPFLCYIYGFSVAVKYYGCLWYRKMTGLEYLLNEVIEPNLFVIRKQKRDSPEKVTPMLTYYVLDGSIYQAPQLCNVFNARIVSYFLNLPLNMIFLGYLISRILGNYYQFFCL